MALTTPLKILYAYHLDYKLEKVSASDSLLSAGNAQLSLLACLAQRHAVWICNYETVDIESLKNYDLLLFNITNANYRHILLDVPLPKLGILTEIRHDLDWFNQDRDDLLNAFSKFKGIWTMGSVLPVGDKEIDYPMPACETFLSQAQLFPKENVGIVGFWDGWGCWTTAKVLSGLGLDVIIPSQWPERTQKTSEALGIRSNIIQLTDHVNHASLISKCRLGMQISFENRAGGAALKAAFVGTPYISTGSDYWATQLFPELLVHSPKQAYLLGKRLLNDSSFYAEITEVTRRRFNKVKLENPEYCRGLDELLRRSLFGETWD